MECRRTQFTDISGSYVTLLLHKKIILLYIQTLNKLLSSCFQLLMIKKKQRNTSVFIPVALFLHSFAVFLFGRFCLARRKSLDQWRKGGQWYSFNAQVKGFSKHKFLGWYGFFSWNSFYKRKHSKLF